MTYAPICIPTLNRYEHLRKCLESLSRCTWADQTEVYVALDYPPANQWDKYAPGWEKNREFLRSCGDMGFKKLHVIEREENYGIWDSKRSNAAELVSEAVKNGEPYIFSEDDNVFSPCFLEYMNKAIEKFKDDKTVYAICGYTHPYSIKSGDNTYFRQNNDYSAWGCARLPGRIRKVDYKWFRDHCSLGTIIRMRKNGRYRLAGFLRAMEKTDDDFLMIDTGVSIVAALQGMDFICPTVSLVRNIGGDGSGINFTSNEDPVGQMLLHQEISSAEHFGFVGTGYEFYDENKRIYRNNSWGEISRKKLFTVIVKTIVKRIVRG